MRELRNDQFPLSIQKMDWQRERADVRRFRDELPLAKKNRSDSVGIASDQGYELGCHASKESQDYCV